MFVVKTLRDLADYDIRLSRKMMKKDAYSQDFTIRIGTITQCL